MINAGYVLYYIITGLVLGTFYGLATVGLSFTFGVLRVLNSGHGSFIMIGAYISYWLFVIWGLPPLISFLLSFLVGFVLGLGIYYGMISRVLKAPELISLVIMFAVGIILAEFAKFVWTPTIRGFEWNLGRLYIFGIAYPVTRLIGGVASAVTAFALYFLLYKTKIGKAIRSVVEDADGAALCGVNLNRTYAISLALALGLTVASGSLATLFVSGGIEPYMGNYYTNLAFAIAVMGGLTSPFGAFIGGLILGLIENISYILFSLANVANPFSMTQFVDFAMILIILLTRPQGILKR